MLHKYNNKNLFPKTLEVVSGQFFELRAQVKTPYMSTISNNYYIYYKVWIQSYLKTWLLSEIIRVFI